MGDAQEPCHCLAREEVQIAKGVLISEHQLLQLQKELMKDNVMLKNTTLGRLYLDYVDKWIKEKAKKKRQMKDSGNATYLTQLDQDIANLKAQRKDWKDMKFPF